MLLGLGLLPPPSKKCLFVLERAREHVYAGSREE